MSGLSNNELREKLIELGENPGPISAATRSVYLKRLERLSKFKIPVAVQERNTAASATSSTSTTSKKKVISNSELRKKLVDLGAKPGPITEKTRQLYLKHLDGLLAKQESQQNEKNPIQIAEENAEIKTKKSAVATRTSKNALLAATTPKSTSTTRKTFGFSSDESDTNGIDHNPNDKVLITPATNNRKSTTTTTNKKVVNSSTTTSQQPDDQTFNNIKTRMQQQQQSNGIQHNGYSDDSDVDSSRDASMVDASTSPMISRSSIITNRQSTPIRRMQLARQSLLTAKPSPIINNNNTTSTRSSLLKQPVSSTTTPLPRLRFNQQPPFSNSSSHLERNSFLTQATPPSPAASCQPTVTQPPATSSPWSKIKQFFSWENRGSCAAASSLETNVYLGSNAKPITKSSWPLLCSHFLLYATVGFFALLGLLYITMKTDHAQDTTPILGEDSGKPMRHVNLIFEILGTAAGSKLCNYSTEDRVHVSDVRNIAKIHEHDMKEALALICKYPKWQIHMYENLADKETISSCDDLHLVNYMSSHQAFLPAMCRLTRAFKKIFVNTILIITFCCLMWIGFRLHKYQQARKERETREIFTLVDKVIELVEKQQMHSELDDGVDRFIPIIQARDMLIPISERKSKLKLWQKVVDFIAENDSRIRVETQRVSGQDHLVWRWVQVKSPHSSPSSGGSIGSNTNGGQRMWQGEAFDMKTCTNAPVTPPSSCLKIRNVFNPESERSENWEYEIQDSILEKCSNSNDILAIVVEKTAPEGLVYIKCSSNEAAGKVFRSLHGSWFDRRLITVKFLKLKRFTERYPQHSNTHHPLKHHFPRPVSNFSPTNVSSM